jgi:predicted nucleic acid-binding protein
VLIGFLDENDAHHVRAVRELRPWLAAGNTLLLPATVFSELLVGPARLGVHERVEAFVDEAGMEVVPVNRSIARRAAHLRATVQSLRLPDALVIATAVEREASLLTLDERLQRIVERLVTSG